jgi:hypothetical protein
VWVRKGQEPAQPEGILCDESCSDNKEVQVNYKDLRIRREFHSRYALPAGPRISPKMMIQMPITMNWTINAEIALSQ